MTRGETLVSSHDALMVVVGTADERLRTFRQLQQLYDRIHGKHLPQSGLELRQHVVTDSIYNPT
jgi:hypothetical protein